MKFSTHRLDSYTRDYLTDIDRTKGDGHDGVFVRTSYTPNNPRKGSGALIFLGLIAGAVTAILTIPSIIDRCDLGQLPYWQAGLLSVSLLFLGFGIRRSLRKSPAAPFQSFIYADASYLWRVNPETVEAIDLRQMTQIEAFQMTHAGIYLMTILKLHLPGRVEEISLFRQESAREMYRYLDVVHAVLSSSNPDVTPLASDPARLGALAKRLLHDESTMIHEVVATGPKPPEPYEDDEIETITSSKGRLVPWFLAGAAALLGVLVLPAVDRFLLDQHLYAKVTESHDANFQPLDHYLARLPDGPHFEDVRTLRDDRKFALAKREADTKRSPAAWRTYLADGLNRNHRIAAQERVNYYYDEAIKLLEARAAKNPEKIDAEMFQAVIALLKGMKTSPNPLVTIGFHATIEREPMTAEQKLREKMTYDFRLEDSKELRDLERRRGNVIMSCGSVFDATQVTRREQVIVERLTTAVQQVVNADLIQFVPVTAGEKPMFEVAYDTVPSGRLYLYTKSTPGRSYKETLGLLRGYDVNWTITIRPPGSDKEHVCKLTSRPASQLHYDEAAGDPDWAVYAVILYSGFYEMSNRLIVNFGIESPATQTNFTYAMATGKK